MALFFCSSIVACKASKEFQESESKVINTHNVTGHVPIADLCSNASTLYSDVSESHATEERFSELLLVVVF